MDRVVLPHRRAMEAAVDPVHHEVRRDQEDRRLQPQRQLRQRPVAVVVELDQAFGGGDAEQPGGAEHQQADAQIAREQRDDEPIAEIGDELALAPPGPARIAGPEVAEHGEDGAEHEQHRHELHHRHAHAVDDRDDFFQHDANPTLTLH